jgi:recombination protein RecT
MPRTPDGQIVKRSDAVKSVQDTLVKYKAQLQMALPKHVSVDQMIRSALTCVRKTPKLLDCSQASLFGSIMQASQLGLRIDDGLGHAYLVPYGKECTLIVGYRGLVDLARRSGDVSTVEARAVFEGDAFEYTLGLTPRLVHTPCGETAPDKLTHVYAIMRMRDGGQQFDVMNRTEVETIRNRSRAKGAGPWVTDYAEMARKTVLRRLCKLAPMSIEAQKAVTLDEMADANISQNLDVEWQTAIEAKPETETDDVMDKPLNEDV